MTQSRNHQARKLYAGVKLREIRTRIGLTQANYASKLGVSLSYLNQMENNHRPISARVLLSLAEQFGVDIVEISKGSSERMMADLREAFSDPVFDSAPPLGDMQLVASNAPNFAHAFLALHRAHRQTEERLAQLNEALGREDSILAPLPWEEVRDFFHYCDNYIDPIDRAAEHFASKITLSDRRSALSDWLNAHHDISVNVSPETELRDFDPTTKVLRVSALAPPSTQAFQILHQIALVEHNELLDATLDLARFSTPAARSICKTGLANYFAGAAMMPYDLILNRAKALRHDLEALSAEFEASVEQVSQRLSTLQRIGAKGVPFFFVRVDQAGTITKRHSATQLQFARFGGSCPLWNVHRAFASPGHFLRQLAVTPEGVKYFCLARDVVKPGGRFHAPSRWYAIGLGCEIAHASELVYADGLDLKNDAAYEPIGISCRICPRKTCAQRSVPPMEGNLEVTPNQRGLLPYSIA
ncbi:MAG: short-chain fatty acyl-CoA regulator family protein [Pseudomonadota bacterium]